MKFSSFLILFICASVPLWFNSRPAQAQPDAHEHAAEAQSPKDETNADYLWRKSDEAFHAGDYERAIGLHKAIVALDPHDVQSFGVAAWLMWSLGHNEEALTHIARGLKSNPESSYMWDEAAQHYQLQAGRDMKSPLIAKAKDAFVRSVQLLPKDADKNDAQMLRRRLAHAAEHAGDMNLALQTWQKLVEDYPTEAVNKNNLARVEEEMKGKQPVAMSGVLGGGALLLLALLGKKKRQSISV